MGKIRIFIAFDTTPEIKEYLAEIAGQLRRVDADIRWEPKEKYHATLKFLGDIDESLLPAIAIRISETAGRFRPITLRFDRLGCFPNMRNPRVFWAGCTNHDPAISDLKTQMDEVLAPFGFEIERRIYDPHVTLGRFKSDRGSKHLISSVEKITFEAFNLPVQELMLMKSVLNRDGSQYTVLRTFGLNGGE